jgi:hypothetical protein
MEQNALPSLASCIASIRRCMRRGSPHQQEVPRLKPMKCREEVRRCCTRGRRRAGGRVAAIAPTSAEKSGRMITAAPLVTTQAFVALRPPLLDQLRLKSECPVRVSLGMTWRQPPSSSASSTCKRIVSMWSNTACGGCTWCTPSFSVHGPHRAISNRRLIANGRILVPVLGIRILCWDGNWTKTLETLIHARSNDARAASGNRCAGLRAPLRSDSPIAASHSSVALSARNPPSRICHASGTYL